MVDIGSALGGAPATLRHRPVQRRSQERLGRILDACATVLGEAGYEALSTTQVARRAGVPVGSVYQFFPDKRAAVGALIRRYLVEFESRTRAGLAADPPAGWSGVADALVEVYGQMHRQVPGFGRVHFGDHVDPHLLDPERANTVVVAGALVPLVAEATGVAPDRLQVPVQVAVDAVDGMVRGVVDGGEREDLLLVEVRAMLGGYLERRLGPLA